MIRVEKIQIPTLPTKQPRRLYVYLPRDYETSDRRYPVLYMFDGHNVFYDRHATYGKSWGMKEYLERTKLPLILVAVECNHEGDSRLSEYCPWDCVWRGKLYFPGRGKQTMDWFAGDLKNRIDAAYRTLPDRAHTYIAGSSMGGLMALYAAVDYTGVYGGAAALSPSLDAAGKHLEALIRGSGLGTPTRIYMDYGTDEGPGSARMAAAMFRTAERLTKKGAHVAARVIPGAKHCEADWEKRIPVFLPYLL